MKINSTFAKVNGTCLQGFILINLQDLIMTLGEPIWFKGDKVTAEWIIEDMEGRTATIYDWKQDRTPSDEYRWHIGGHNPDALDLIRSIFPHSKISDRYDFLHR